MIVDRIRTLSLEFAEWATQCRRHLHANPELSSKEKETSQFIEDELRKMGNNPETGIGGYGVKAVIQGGRGSGKTIALRADIDALPILEETNLPFASRTPGVMHACGHDVHTAVLLGAAKALPGIMSGLSGQVVLVFQPAEESGGGAIPMINDGVLENPHVDAIFGIHVEPDVAAGKMAFGCGPVMAAADEFDLVITGRDGHGGRPHTTVDAVYVASQVVVAFQGIVSRNNRPFDPVVISVGSFHGGSKHNIIAGEATLQGTIRTMDSAVRERIIGRMDDVARGVCQANGATHRLVVRKGYPVVKNSEAETQIARRAAGLVLGPDNVVDMKPSMGSEDFACYLAERPGSFARLGIARPEGGHFSGLHTSRFLVDERAIPVGIGYWLSLVQCYLGESR